MTSIGIFAVCIVIFVLVSVITAVIVYKSQMRKNRMQQGMNQTKEQDNR